MKTMETSGEPRVMVVGVGLCREDLTEKQIKMISGAEVLVGGKRHLEWFADHGGITRPITAPISQVISDIRGWMTKKKVVVLASGDPLLHGIGKTLIENLGAQNVKIVPNVSSLAAAFARIKMPWHDVRVISFHGVDAVRELSTALFTEDKLFLLTDPRHTPPWLASVVDDLAPGRWRMCVLEMLGTEQEKVRWFCPENVEGMEFSQPNVAVLVRDQAQEPNQVRLTLGADENEYAHERGMITKSEVRAVSLAKLRLAPEHVLWDLGAASGSVAIEAALFIRSGKIVAVEKNGVRVGHIRENIRKFGVSNIQVIQGELPEAIDERLPDPDRVFIGGGGKDLVRILERVSKRLKKGGRVVVNTVLVETLATAMETFKALGFHAEVAQVQVNESKAMKSGMRLAAKNPVWIVSGQY